MVSILGDPVTTVEAGIVVATLFYMFTSLVTPLLGSKIARLSLYVSALVSFVILAYLGYSTIAGVNYVKAFGGAILLDQFALYLLTIGMMVVGLGSLATGGVVDKWESGEAYYAVIGLLALGVLAAGLAGSLYIAYVAWILVAVSSYVLVALYKDDTSAEAAMKYAVMGSVATIVLLLAVQLYYGSTRSSSIGAQVLVSDKALLLPIIALIIVSIGFKMGVVPFHGWVVDVYGNIKPIVVSIISAMAKIFAVLLVVKLIIPYASAAPFVLLSVAATLSVFTMFLGNIGALTTIRDSPQKLLAYSSIAQAGYLLMGIAMLAKVPGVDNKAALAGIALHTAGYALSKLASFTVLDVYCEYPGCKWKPLRGLLWRDPVAASALVLALASLMGMPPTLGFWGKVYIVKAAVTANPLFAILLVVNFVIAAFYYGYLIYQLFQPFEGPEHHAAKPRIRARTALLAATLTLVLGLVPTIAYGLAVYGYTLGF